MTVWLVTLNNHVQGVTASEAGAAQLIQDLKQSSPRLRKESWRGAGLSWCSDHVTTLHARTWDVTP